MGKLALAIVGLGILVLSAAPAQAQATRTWVSGVGSDANPCSRTAPCKTFAGAISKTFINGEINCLDPGGFGAVTITKSITIDCHEVFASILASGTTGIIINIAVNANDPLRTVRIRNLNINGAGASGTIGTRTGINGIRIDAALDVFIEDVMIDGFTQRGILDQRAAAGNLYVSNTTLRNMAGAGAAVAPSSGAPRIDATFTNVLSENNTFGIAIGSGARAIRDPGGGGRHGPALQQRRRVQHDGRFGGGQLLHQQSILEQRLPGHDHPHRSRHDPDGPAIVSSGNKRRA